MSLTHAAYEMGNGRCITRFTLRWHAPFCRIPASVAVQPAGDCRSTPSLAKPYPMSLNAAQAIRAEGRWETALQS
jgi:hypothetical protein